MREFTGIELYDFLITHISQDVVRSTLENFTQLKKGRIFLDTELWVPREEEDPKWRCKQAAWFSLVDLFRYTWEEQDRMGLNGKGRISRIHQTICTSQCNEEELVQRRANGDFWGFKMAHKWRWLTTEDLMRLRLEGTLEFND